MVQAIIIKDSAISKNISRVGEKVTLLRAAPHKKWWVRLEDGKELVVFSHQLRLIK